MMWKASQPRPSVKKPKMAMKTAAAQPRMVMRRQSTISAMKRRERTPRVSSQSGLGCGKRIWLMRHYSAFWFIQCKQDDGREKQRLGNGVEEVSVRRAEQ